MEKLKKSNPTPVQIGDDLKAYLKHKAIDNGRTLGKEIVARLTESRMQEEKMSAA
ncbi:MAG: hypothetical protein K2X55_26975 [Burkholderiaceae bacterium]|nr:hypothetical protein [Burkholderiaceae bacterium]